MGLKIPPITFKTNKSYKSKSTPSRKYIELALFAPEQAVAALRGFEKHFSSKGKWDPVILIEQDFVARGKVSFYLSVSSGNILADYGKPLVLLKPDSFEYSGALKEIKDALETAYYGSENRRSAVIQWAGRFLKALDTSTPFDRYVKSFLYGASKSDKQIDFDD